LTGKGNPPGKLRAGNRNSNEFLKILEEYEAGEGEYLGKLLPVNRNTTGSKGFSENSGLGKGNIRESSRLHEGNIPGLEEFWVSDIPAWIQERYW
jgi:hypothetical protein